MSWHLVFAKHALKDARKLAESGLKPKAKDLLELLKRDPFESPQSFEKLVGDLRDLYLRRINLQHRLVYQVFESEHTVRVLRMWSHYD